MITQNQLNQEIELIKPAATNDNINNTILTIINDLSKEMTNEHDINFIIAAAENLENDINIKYDIKQLIEIIDSEDYLYNKDGAYYLLECYNTTFFNSILDIEKLYFVPQEKINYNQLNSTAVQQVLDYIEVDQETDLIDFFNMLDYYEIFLPDILSGGFYNSIHQDQLDITPELVELLNQANINQDYWFISESTEAIEIGFINQITNNIIKPAVNQAVNQGAIKAPGVQYKILPMYQYQEF